MKTFTPFIIGIALSGLPLLTGCQEEVSHTESDKPNMLDSGHTHKEQTTYKNADGTYSTESSKTRTTN